MSSPMNNLSMKEAFKKLLRLTPPQSKMSDELVDTCINIVSSHMQKAPVQQNAKTCGLTEHELFAIVAFTLNVESDLGPKARCHLRNNPSYILNKALQNTGPVEYCSEEVPGVVVAAKIGSNTKNSINNNNDHNNNAPSASAAASAAAGLPAAGSNSSSVLHLQEDEEDESAPLVGRLVEELDLFASLLESGARKIPPVSKTMFHGFCVSSRVLTRQQIWQQGEKSAHLHHRGTLLRKENVTVRIPNFIYVADTPLEAPIGFGECGVLLEICGVSVYPLAYFSLHPDDEELLLLPGVPLLVEKVIHDEDCAKDLIEKLSASNLQGVDVDDFDDIPDKLEYVRLRDQDRVRVILDQLESLVASIHHGGDKALQKLDSLISVALADSINLQEVVAQISKIVSAALEHDRDWDVPEKISKMRRQAAHKFLESGGFVDPCSSAASASQSNDPFIIKQEQHRKQQQQQQQQQQKQAKQNSSASTSLANSFFDMVSTLNSSFENFISIMKKASSSSSPSSVVAPSIMEGVALIEECSNVVTQLLIRKADLDPSVVTPHYQQKLQKSLSKAEEVMTSFLSSFAKVRVSADRICFFKARVGEAMTQYHDKLEAYEEAIKDENTQRVMLGELALQKNAGSQGHKKHGRKKHGDHRSSSPDGVASPNSPYSVSELKTKIRQARKRIASLLPVLCEYIQIFYPELRDDLGEHFESFTETGGMSGVVGWEDFETEILSVKGEQSRHNVFSATLVSLGGGGGGDDDSRSSSVSSFNSNFGSSATAAAGGLDDDDDRELQLGDNRFALKEFDTTDPKDSKHFFAEVKAMSRISHPFILPLLTSFFFFNTQTNKMMSYSVTKLMAGTMVKFTKKHRGTHDAQIRRMFVQVCQAVEYLHRHDIIHGDLKPQNVLVSSIQDQAATPFLTDFESCRSADKLKAEISQSFSVSRQSIAATRAYVAPEVPAEISTKIDVYSLGIMYLEFRMEGFMEKHMEILDSKFSTQQASDLIPAPNTAPDFLTQDEVALAKGMLEYDSKKRFTVTQCLNHPALDVGKHAQEKEVELELKRQQLQDEELQIKQDKQNAENQARDLKKEQEKLQQLQRATDESNKQEHQRIQAELDRVKREQSQAAQQKQDLLQRQNDFEREKDRLESERLQVQMKELQLAGQQHNINSQSAKLTEKEKELQRKEREAAAEFQAQQLKQSAARKQLDDFQRQLDVKKSTIDKAAAAPAYWMDSCWKNTTLQDPSASYKKVSVPKYSALFRKVRDAFENTKRVESSGHNKGKIVGSNDASFSPHTGFNIINVWHIENPFLWQRFKLARDKVKNSISQSYFDRFRQKSGMEWADSEFSLDKTVNEAMLFHGTGSESTADLICKNGFDPRYGFLRCVFGSGTYLAECASKSEEYCAHGQNDSCFMVLPRAVLGIQWKEKQWLTSVDMNRKECDAPPIVRVPFCVHGHNPAYKHTTTSGYPAYVCDPRPGQSAEPFCSHPRTHSTMGLPQSFGNFKDKEFIIYDADQIYPELLVEFKRV